MTTASSGHEPVSVLLTDNDDSYRWPTWLAVTVLALLIHALLMLYQFKLAPQPIPPRIDVDTIDPQRIEAIRKQWQAKNLLLNKDKNAPRAAEAPPDARYFSDRNIRVEKEQRASETNVVPRQSQTARTESEQRTIAPRAPSIPAPNIGDLGIPIRLQANTAQASQAARSTTLKGGDQAILDKTLPTGGENMLNARESVYYSFYARIYEAIGPIWQSRIQNIPQRRRLQAGEYSTTVDVVFDREGTLVAIRKVNSSGIPEFDAAVDSAWAKVGRFPNPPPDLLDEAGEIHTGWNFTVHIGGPFQWEYQPPRRAY
jgi:hypothetical protein